MADLISLDLGISAASKFLALLDSNGYALRAAVWAPRDEEEWRLLLLPETTEGDLRETAKVIEIMSMHSDQFPGRRRPRFEIVRPNHPLIQAMRRFPVAASDHPREVRGVFDGPNYFDQAVILRMAA